MCMCVYTCVNLSNTRASTGTQIWENTCLHATHRDNDYNHSTTMNKTLCSVCLHAFCLTTTRLVVTGIPQCRIAGLER